MGVPSADLVAGSGIGSSVFTLPRLSVTRWYIQ
jgi:hypothetical protein